MSWNIPNCGRLSPFRMAEELKLVSRHWSCCHKDPTSEIRHTCSSSASRCDLVLNRSVSLTHTYSLSTCCYVIWPVFYPPVYLRLSDLVCISAGANGFCCYSWLSLSDVVRIDVCHICRHQGSANGQLDLAYPLRPSQRATPQDPSNPWNWLWWTVCW